MLIVNFVQLKKMDKTNSNTNHLIIIFSKDLYEFHYALALASSLKAVGKNVKVFVSGYACNFIKQNWKTYDKENIGKKLEEKKMGTIEDMFSYCKDLDVKMFYCETALEFLNISKNEVTPLVEIKPNSMYSILNSNNKGEIIFI